MPRSRQQHYSTRGTDALSKLTTGVCVSSAFSKLSVTRADIYSYLASVRLHPREMMSAKRWLMLPGENDVSFVPTKWVVTSARIRASLSDFSSQRIIWSDWKLWQRSGFCLFVLCEVDRGKCMVDMHDMLDEFLQSSWQLSVKPLFGFYGAYAKGREALSKEHINGRCQAQW